MNFHPRLRTGMMAGQGFKPRPNSEHEQYRDNLSVSVTSMLGGITHRNKPKGKHMITTVAVLFVVSGLAIFFLSLPLVYRKVSMNELYGIRIPRAMESEQRWYDINAYGGRQLARWSWLVTAVGVIGFFVPAEYLLVYTLGGAGVLLVATVAPLIQILIWSRNHAP